MYIECMRGLECTYMNVTRVHDVGFDCKQQGLPLLYAVEGLPLLHAVETNIMHPRSTAWS